MALGSTAILTVSLSSASSTKWTRLLTLIGLMATPQEVFGLNLERLRKLKAIYDPENAFSKAHAIIPAVEV